MGRKTKKEKIIADLRRKMAKLEVREEKKIYQEPKISLENINSQEKPSFQSPSIYIYPVQFIKKDLTKTIFLTILAISFEVALFFLFEKNINLPFKLSLPIKF